jgi:hypothetical protein
MPTSPDREADPDAPFEPAPPRGRRWVQRADGDRRVRARLSFLEDEGVIVLDDRREPGSSLAIQRIAVSAGGVFVLDTRHFKGLVHTRRPGPMSDLGPDALFIGRRDCSPFIDRMSRQAEVVRDALEDLSGGSDVPVRPMLCLTRARWVVASPIEIQGVCVGWPQLITGRVQVGGTMDSPRVREVSEAIAQRLED